MIHELPVTAETEPDAYGKLFRKKLMTGGAVVVVPPSVTAEECLLIGERFIPRAVVHSIAADVCRALAAHPNAPSDLIRRLRELELPLVTQEIQRREHHAA